MNEEYKLWTWVNATDVVPGELLYDDRSGDDRRVVVIVAVESLLDPKEPCDPDVWDFRHCIVWTLGPRGLVKRLVRRHYDYFKRLL